MTSSSKNRTPVTFFATLLVAAPLALLLSWPQALGAETAPVIAHAVSFRAVLALGLGTASVFLGTIALIRRRWAVSAGLAIALLAASAANATVLLSRGASTALPEGDLTVVAWNTYRTASAEDIARLVIETGADVVSLPETGAETATEAARLATLAGVPMTADTTLGGEGYPNLPTSLLVSAELGDYRHDADAGTTPAMPSGAWVPVGGSGPTLVAAHPIPPLPESMADWRAGMAWVEERCAEDDVILAGDLNATVDHLASHLGACRDAATEAGAAAVGTWPALVPTWIGSPIDHVLVGSAWEVRGTDVLTSFDDAGSDHRPIVAVLARR